MKNCPTFDGPSVKWFTLGSVCSRYFSPVREQSRVTEGAKNRSKNGTNATKKWRIVINQTNSLNLRLKSAKNPPTYKDDPPHRQGKGRRTMSVSLRSFTFSRLAAAAIAASLWWAGPAWAGGGGADASTLQSSLNAICGEVGMTSTCPQLPTATQIFLEISGLLNSPPDDVRNIFAVSPCGNLFFPGPPLPDGRGQCHQCARKIAVGGSQRRDLVSHAAGFQAGSGGDAIR